MLAAAKPALGAARAQWRRRGASAGADLDPATVEREFEEALNTLTGDVARLSGWFVQVLKSRLSDRSDLFDNDEVREWLRIDAARAMIKAAAADVIMGRPIDQHRSDAGQSYAQSSGDDAGFGGALFDIAVAFLVLTIDAQLSTEGRVVLQVVNARGDELRDLMMDVRDTIGRLEPQGSADSDELPPEVANDYLTRGVKRELRLRAVVDPDRPDRVENLAQKARDGWLRRAPADTRIAAFRMAALILGREGRTDEAEAWLQASVDIGAGDLVADRARLAIRRGEEDTAIALLAGRDDALSQSLTVEAMEQRDGRAAALQFRAQFVRVENLTGFMLSAVGTWTAEEGDWTQAEAIFAQASDAQIEENPILLFVRARLEIALLTPPAHRGGMLDNPVGFAHPSVLRDDEEGARLRTAALRDLTRLEQVLTALEEPNFAETVEGNRLYLELGSANPAVANRATEILRERLGDPESATRYLWLASAFDIAFDDRPLRDHLEKIRLLTGWTDAQLTSAFDLAMRRKDEDVLLAFIADHRDRLGETAPVELAFGLEVEVLARKGRVEEASARLAAAETRLGDKIVTRLRAIIAEQQGGNPVTLRLAAFEQSGSEADLNFLVQALAEARDTRTGDYAADLWRLRHRTDDAILACNAYFDAGRDRELDAFLSELGLLVDSVPRLREHIAWSRYRAGALDEALRILEPLRLADPDRAHLRQLEINLALEAGDWNRLGPLIRQDLERRDQRDAEQLIQSANLAHAANDDLADELARAAVAKAPEDPEILLHSYQLAVRRGRDWDGEASDWLNRAIALSGESGPLRPGKLRDLVRMRDEDRRRSADLDRMIMTGQIPLGMATRPLGTTLSELVLGRLAGNVGQRDAMARMCLPMIAGNRIAADLTGAEKVAFDPGALLLLQLCGLLPATLEAFDQIVIAPGTLPLLFNDLERARRTQPSRVMQAARIKALIDQGSVATFDEGESEDDFIPLFERAEQLDGLVFHSLPLFEPGSFNEQVRDPSPFTERLVGGDAIVAALAASGEITGEELTRAGAAMRGLGGEWPDAPLVDLDKPLILDSTVLHALDDAGVLDALVVSGAQLHTPRSTLEHAEREIEGQRRSVELERAIEAVRTSMRTALLNGKARVSPFHRIGRRKGRSVEDELERDAELTPMISLLQDASAFEVLVSGDRVVNQHGHVTDEAKIAKPVVTPLDVIDQLERAGRIDVARRTAARRKLREAGVAMIPASADEIMSAVAESNWAIGGGRSLRAIAASLHLPLLRKAVQLPVDRHWLESVTVALTVSIRRCWRELAPEIAKVASDYLFALIPALASHVSADQDADGPLWAQNVLTASYALLAMPLDIPRERLPEYREWYEQVPGARLDGRDRLLVPAVYERIRLVLLMQEDVVPEEKGSEEIAAVDIRRLMVSLLPDRHRTPVTDNAEVRAALGLCADCIDLAGHEVRIGDFADFLRRALVGEASPLVGQGGSEIAARGEANADGSVSILVGGERLRVHEAGLFSEDATIRTATIERMLANRRLAPSAADRWRAAAASEPIPPDLFMILAEAVNATPQAFVEHIVDLSSDELTFGSLAVLEARHYENILDPERGDGTLPGTLAALALSWAGDPDPAGAIEALAPLRVSPDFPLGQLADGLDAEAVATLTLRLLELGDPFGVIAGLELACPRAESPACADAIDRFVQRLLGDDTLLDNLAYDFSTVALIALTLTDRHNTLADWPLSLRRCGVLAHAGYAVRALQTFEVNRNGLFEEIQRWAMPRAALNAILDRSEGPVWAREWLQPRVVKGYALRRIAAALADVPAGHGKAEWVESFQKALERCKEAGLGVSLQLHGPLDEFGRTFLQVLDDPAPVIDALETADAAGAEALLFGMLWSYSAPDDAGLLAERVHSLIVRASAPDRAGIARMGLSVATRWRLPMLADRIMEAVWNDPEHAGFATIALTEITIAAALAHAEPAQQREALGQRLGRIVFGGLPAAERSKIARVLDTVANAKPEWAETLELLRSAALLPG
ncbi:hypothetical protein AB5I39_08800 [Sphingomonas sp. MMS24-J45]|uniref:HTH domain-containing protein n=1 Tax=Sphingomonas sp. MMS24-J45 TaxID=3238806 RepID=UPI00384C80A0